MWCFWCFLFFVLGEQNDSIKCWFRRSLTLPTKELKYKTAGKNEYGKDDMYMLCLRCFEDESKSTTLRGQVFGNDLICDQIGHLSMIPSINATFDLLSSDTFVNFDIRKTHDYDPDNEVEITVVNIGSDVSSNEQFKCLVENDGNKEDDNYICHDSDDLSDLDGSDVIDKLCNKRVVPCSINLECPTPCTNDPYDCIYEEVQDCIMNTYHPNGCDQCMNGYFKKDYNYPCVSCKDTFGDDCIHCTDFLGCQQCSVGTYDPDCDDGECDNADTTGDENDDDDSGSDSSDSRDSDSGDSGTVYSGTPSPTQSTVDSDTETTGAYSNSETTRVVRVCTDGYFGIVSVSRPDSQFLLGKYYENGETSTSGYPEFQLDSDEYNIIGYLVMEVILCLNILIVMMIHIILS